MEIQGPGLVILAIDVHYEGPEAMVAGVQMDDYASAEATQTYHLRVPVGSKYESGQFYKRELPCILELLKHYRLKPDTIFIDGYVHLGTDKRPGLGQHLYDALNGQTNVIGVAKSPYSGVSRSSEAIRGQSTRPLYVTAAGMGQDEAKRIVKSMAGAHRVPRLLKLADMESRTRS